MRSALKTDGKFTLTLERCLGIIIPTNAFPRAVIHESTWWLYPFVHIENFKKMAPVLMLRIMAGNQICKVFLFMDKIHIIITFLFRQSIPMRTGVRTPRLVKAAVTKWNRVSAHRVINQIEIRHIVFATFKYPDLGIFAVVILWIKHIADNVVRIVRYLDVIAIFLQIIGNRIILWLKVFCILTNKLNLHCLHGMHSLSVM